MESILEAARELVGSRGNDAVSVREIAARAGVPIASVYQYFPDKNAILRRLMEGYLAVLRARWAEVLEPVRSAAQLADAMDACVDVFVRLFREEPALATIWASVQANTVLRALDAQDTREDARRLAGVFLRLRPRANREEVARAALFAAHTLGTTVRLALTLDPKTGRGLLGEFRTVLRLRIRDLVGG